MNWDQIQFWCIQRLAYRIWEKTTCIVPQRAESDFTIAAIYLLLHKEFFAFIQGQMGNKQMNEDDLERLFSGYISDTVFLQMKRENFLPSALYTYK